MQKQLLIIIAVIIGVIVGSIGTLLIYKSQFKQNVKETIFSECFDYYANLDKENGISQENVSVCIEKANRWTEEIDFSNLK